MFRTGFVFSLFVILASRSCVAEESLSPDNGVRVLDEAEQAFRRLEQSRLPAAAMQDAMIVVAHVERTVDSVQLDKTLSKEVKAGKVLNAIQAIQDLQRRWERSAASAQNSTVVESVQSDLLKKRLAEKEAELALKKKDLDLEAAKLKVAGVEKQMLAKKEELQRIMDLNSGKKVDLKPAPRAKGNVSAPTPRVSPSAARDAPKKEAPGRAAISAAPKPTTETAVERESRLAVEAGQARAARILAKAKARRDTPKSSKMFNLDSMGTPEGRNARKNDMPARLPSMKRTTAAAQHFSAQPKASVVAAKHIQSIAASAHKAAVIQRNTTVPAGSRNVTAMPALKALPHNESAAAALSGSLRELTRLRGMASKVAGQSEKAHGNFLH